MRELEIAHRVAVSEVLASKIVADEGEYSVLNKKDVMQVMARKMGYKLNSFVMRSTLGDTWTFESKRDFLEIQVSFDKKGTVDVYALPMDEFTQEPLAEKENIRLRGDLEDDFAIVAKHFQKVRAEALKGELVEHLRLESQL